MGLAQLQLLGMHQKVQQLAEQQQLVQIASGS
jgi:hypothetical protein